MKKKKEPADKPFVFRTTGKWGRGADRPLTYAEFDRNMWLIDEKLKKISWIYKAIMKEKKS